jgi:hypothetical protein
MISVKKKQLKKDITPISDIKDIFKKLKYKTFIIDKSLSGHCVLTNTCAKDLRVINRDNGLTLSGCPMNIRRQFFENYKNELANVDMFYCTYPPAMGI